MMTIQEYLNPNEEIYTHVEFSDDDFIEMSTQDDNEIDDEPEQQLATMDYKLKTVSNMCGIMNQSSEDHIVLLNTLLKLQGEWRNQKTQNSKQRSIQSNFSKQ